MTFDLAAIRRRLKPERRVTTLRRRPMRELAFADEASIPRATRLLFDTCVYIDAAAHRLPIEVANLVRSRVSYHSMVCAAELTYAVGVLDPKDPRTKQQGKVLAEILDRIAATGRTIPPNETDWAAAGVMAGMLSRSQNYAKDQKRKALADCLVFLSALRSGLTLLTANLAEFDLLQQILPEARVAFYRIA